MRSFLRQPLFQRKVWQRKGSFSLIPNMPLKTPRSTPNLHPGRGQGVGLILLSWSSCADKTFFAVVKAALLLGGESKGGG